MAVTIFDTYQPTYHPKRVGTGDREISAHAENLLLRAGDLSGKLPPGSIKKKLRRLETVGQRAARWIDQLPLRAGPLWKSRVAAPGGSAGV